MMLTSRLAPKTDSLEAQDYLLLKVTAASWLARGPPRGVSEEGIENVAKAAKNIEPVKGAAAGLGAAADAGLAKAVILPAFLGIGEHLIRLVDFLELIFGVGALVTVGMILHGLSSEGPAYLLLAGISGNAQEGVIVLVRHQQSLKARREPMEGRHGRRAPTALFFSTRRRRNYMAHTPVL